jgi:hypothetical protein
MKKSENNPVLKIVFIISMFYLFFNLKLTAQTDYSISIERFKSGNGLIYGKISINGSLIGNCYENNDLKIPSGNYKGNMRYNSGKGFVQNPFGSLGKEGDFLLEVTGVSGRTNILFHSGNKPSHSQGCILLGPVNRDISGCAYIDEFHPLRKLRILFYGSETPNYCPDKNISIEIIDNYKLEDNSVNEDKGEKVWVWNTETCQSYASKLVYLKDLDIKCASDLRFFYNGTYKLYCPSGHELDLLTLEGYSTPKIYNCCACGKNYKYCK